ncbi:MAG: phytoene desaturase family protein [Pseudomonadales bacterium]
MSKGVIIGGGHNGLVAACYLAKAGHQIEVFEARQLVGGAAVTEEFHPGFRNSTASYTVSLLHPKVQSDLNLQNHGLEIIERPISNLLPLPDGRYLTLHPDIETSQASIGQFSKADAQNLPRYYKDLDEVVPVVRWVMEQTPPNISHSGLADIFKAIQLGGQFRKLSEQARARLLKLFTLSAAEFLSEYFESAELKALFGFDAVVGHFDSPYSPGSAYVLLHHVVGGVNGKSGTWGHAVGGMGAITEAMAKEAEQLGVTIHVNSAVSQVLVDRGRASGIRLKDGQEVHSDFVVSNCNPQLLMTQLLPKTSVPADVAKHFQHYKNRSGTFRLNVALSQLPQFLCRPEPDALSGGIILAPSLDYMEAAFMTAKQQGFAARPIVEMLIPSTLDDSLAPPGKHVASLFCQHFSPDLGAAWTEHKDAAINAIFAVVESYAPGFKDSILATQAHSPFDLEEKFGLSGGDIFHGRLSLDQLYSARPMSGMAQYKSHIHNLFLCGSGTHPGGGVSGIPGMNAAREIIRAL